nr:reverse transcriptase domain-containing protein [Tanacetum cinerariifolium]
MRTRSQSHNNSPQQQASPVIVEPLRIELPFLEDQFQEDPPPEVPMADNRTMAELLQAPTEAWDRFNDLLMACPHHGFFELHQLDTFYNALNVNDQDSLNSAAGGNFLDKMPSECLKIIESKSKVRQSRAKAVVAKVNSSSSTLTISSDVAELKDMVRALLLDKKHQYSALTPSPTPAHVKAVKPNCVTCCGTHLYQNCPATSGNVYQDNIQESQAATANYSQGNTGFRPQMVANQIRRLEFPPVQNNQNNFNRGNTFNQNRGGNFNQSNFNQGQLHRPQVNQPPAYQALAYQAPIPQMQSVSQTDFKRYVKANDAVLRNIQSQGQRSGKLHGNTITNLKEDLKGITTRSGVAYQGPIIPTPSKLLNKEPSVPMPNLKPSIPYPSRRDNERRRDQANEQIEKFYEIFKDMSFEISFTNALIFMPKFASTLKALIGNKKKLSEMSRTPMNEHCSTVIVNKLPKKLRDPGKFFIPYVKVKVGVFHFPADFVVVDFKPDPRVPLILGRCFLKTGRALIDVYKGELTLRIRNEAITYNLDQTSRYSANYDQMTANKNDVTDEVCEEYSQKVLSFSDVTANHEQSMPSFKNELKACEAKTIKSSVDEPPEVELKDLPPHHEYAFLEGDNKLPIIISKELGDEEKSAMIKVSPVHCVPKMSGFIVVENEENELIPTRLVTRWRVCFDYRKLNEATRKDHFSLPFIDQMLERLAGNEYYCFLDGFFGYFQIPIGPRDQEKTTFTCPYGMFAYHRMPFGLCNASSTFQRCMLAIFHNMVEKTIEVFMDDFSVFGNSFENCLSRLDKMLQRCEDTKLCLNWEKSHFMVKEGTVLSHKISKNGIEVDKAKIDVITKLPHSINVKGVQSFLGHVGFYRRFLKDFSKISRPMTHLLERDTLFIFFKDCIKAFQTLKKKLTEAPILIAPK